MDYDKIADAALLELRKWQSAHPKPDSPGKQHDFAEYVTMGIIAAIKEYENQK